MASLLKWLILAHRYLGIALALQFLMWFVSGVAIIYARDMRADQWTIAQPSMVTVPFQRKRPTPVRRVPPTRA